MKYRRMKETSLSFFPLPIQKGSLKKTGHPLSLPVGEVAKHGEDGEGILPLPMGEVAEHCEDGEG